MLDINAPEIQFAWQAVRRASLLVQKIQQEAGLVALTKSDLSPVTVADFASQALFGHLLDSAFPAHVLVAEEDSKTLQEPDQAAALEMVTTYVAGEIPGADPEDVCAWIDRGGGSPARRFWTLDPIDGTKGFLRGDQYAIALALVVDSQVQMGVIGCPNLREGIAPDPGGPGSLVIAVRGQGAWVTKLDQPSSYSRLQVSSRTDPAQARLLRSFESGHTNTGQIGELIDLLGVAAEPVRMDSQAKYCLLAAGGGELMVRLLSPSKPNYREKIWDQAAGSIILEEAGGLITDLNGLPLDFSAGRMLAGNRGVLASNSYLHPAALNALKTIGA
jgi:HAL2 family 3'(2'),5'-bisphosphate nucleotidase